MVDPRARAAGGRAAPCTRGRRVPPVPAPGERGAVSAVLLVRSRCTPPGRCRCVSDYLPHRRCHQSVSVDMTPPGGGFVSSPRTAVDGGAFTATVHVLVCGNVFIHL